MKEKRTKKLLSILLTLVLLIGMLPVTASAGGGEMETGEILRFSKGILEEATRYVIYAEYGGNLYVMGEQTGSGRKAIRVSDENVLPLSEFEMNSADITVFTMETGEETKTVSGGGGSSTFWPLYFKEDDGSYLTVDTGTSVAGGTENLLTTVTDGSQVYWITSWYDRWTGSYNYWKDDIINYAAYSAYNNRIVLNTSGESEEDYYFTVTSYSDDTHISTRPAYITCRHENMQQIPEIPATCRTKGRIAYYQCPDCGRKYLDVNGYEYAGENLEMLAYGAIDNNNDGFCDDCGKSMPVFTKVTNANEIVMESKYLLVSEIGDKLYAMAPPVTDEKGKGSDSTLLPAVEVTPETDGTIRYQTAKNTGAFIFQSGFAAECCDLDQGEIRYELRGTVNGRSTCLVDQFGSFLMDEYSKYGYRLALNTDGTARVDSVYSESWDEAADNGYMRAYKMTNDSDTGCYFSILQASEYNGEGKNYEGAELYKFPVYFYRLTERGTADNGVSYTMNDVPSTTNYDSYYTENPDIIPAAVQMSNVSGMSEALTQEAIEGFVTQASAGGENVKLNVDVNITAKEYTQAEDTGNSVTFTLTPYVAADGVSGTYEISDACFNGLSEMKVTLYVGNFYPQQIIHHKQDGTKEYFYEEWSPQVQGQGAKPFTISYLSGGKTGGFFATFYVTEFSDITLNEIPVAEGDPVEFSVSLGSDITVNAYAAVEGAQIRFTMNGNSVTLDGEPAEKKGEYVYRFQGVAPQLMGDTIRVEMISGKEVTCIKEDFSVKAYCEAILAKSAAELGITEEKFTAMKSLIYNLLQYGDAARTYTGYEGTSFIDVAGYSPDTIGAGYIGSSAEKVVNASADENNKFTAANIWFDNVNRLMLRIATDDISSIAVKMGDVTYTYADNPAYFKASGTTWLFYSEGISALNFDKNYSISLLVNGAEVQTITYSVNAYIKAKQDQTDGEGLTKLAGLVRATYVYGASAKALAAIE